MMESLNNVSHVDDDEILAFGSDTKLNNLTESRFLKEKSCNECCLRSELEEFLRIGTHDSNAICFEGYQQSNG